MNASTVAVVINYNTPDLTIRAIESFCRYIPDTPLLLIDNGSAREHIGALRDVAEKFPSRVSVKVNDHNLHHGPAMDQAFHLLNASYLLFLDSDCVLIHEGMLTAMEAEASRDDRVYAVGHRIMMSERGFDMPGPAGIQYIRPYCMLVRRDMYLTLPPFDRHGAPCLRNMKAAAERGFLLVDFPVTSYVLHEGRGTASRFGYKLGLKGKINHLLHRLGL